MSLVSWKGTGCGMFGNVYLGRCRTKCIHLRVWSVSIFRARLCYFVGNAFTCSIRCALAAIAVIVLRLFVGAFVFFEAPQFLACKILITDLHCHELFQTCIVLFVVIVTSG